MPDKSGKDRGSITQKADDQKVRISQVSNVSSAVTAMGKKTSKEMQETERRINENNDSKEIAGSMNSVLGSLKSTIDSLNKGVEVATLGTAKAAKDAIQQYGQAISEDFKVNRQNMVATALSSSTPIFGYFASKLIDTGIFKKAKDTMKEGLSKIFKQKEKDGLDDMGGMGGSGKGAAKAAQNAKMDSINKKKDTIDTYKVIDKQRHEKYEAPENDKVITALSAIQSALGAQIGKFDQWYGKFLLEHPYFRAATIAYKATKATFGGIWKATYFFWKPRGGYKRQLSKAKQPLEAINQNIATLFVQQMPRLDAIMLYTKATAQASRDLSSHVTGKKYPMMDASKLGGTWNLASGTMKVLRLIGKGVKKGAKKLNKSMFLEGSNASNIFGGAIEGASDLANLVDRGVTGPGRLKKWGMAKLPGSKEKKRMFGGLGATEGSEGGFSGSEKKQKCMPVYFCQKNNKRRLPKNKKGMGRRVKPDLIVQNVYDEFYVNKEKKKEKYDKKLLGYTANSAKFLDKHDKREKRRSVFGLIGGLFSGIGGILTSVMGFALPFLGMFAGGIGKWIKKLFLKGGAIRLGMSALLGKNGPILRLLTSPHFLGPLGAAIGGYAIGTWLNNNVIKPYIMDPYMEYNDKEQKKGIKIEDDIRDKWSKEAKTGTGESAYASKIAMHRRTKMKQQKTLLGGSLAPAAVMAGQMKYLDKNKAKYAKYSVEEIDRARERWTHSLGYYAWYALMSQGKDPEKFGQEKEAAFLTYLQKVGTPMSDEEYQSKVQSYQDSKDVAAGKVVGVAARKTARAAKKAAKEVATKAIVGIEEAAKLVKLYGGEAYDYIGKKLPEADAYGRSLLKKAQQMAAEAKKGAALYGTITQEKAKELSKKYGGVPEEYYHMTVAQAEKYGLKLKEKATTTYQAAIDYMKKPDNKLTVTHEKAKELAKKYGGFPEEYYHMTVAKAKEYGIKVKELAPQVADRIKDQAKKVSDTAGEKAGEAKGWMGKQWESIKKWAESGNAPLKKTGEFIELGKGNFLELYRQGGGQLKEFWETASPEKKAWIRQNAERLLASGQVTAAELKKMGISMTDATVKAGKQVGDSIVQSAVHTTQHISTAVNQTNGGGGGASNQIMQEGTMNEITQGALH